MCFSPLAGWIVGLTGIGGRRSASSNMHSPPGEWWGGVPVDKHKGNCAKVYTFIEFSSDNFFAIIYEFFLSSSTSSRLT